jgi:hypothetical protein
MRKVLAIIAREIREVIPATIFFFVAFHFLIFTKRMILEGYDPTLTSSMVATIGALIVAKAILIADKLPLINLFSDRIPVYGIIWKTIIYLLIVSIFRYIEELIPLHSKYGGWMIANQHLIDEISWPLFWIIQIWIVVLLFTYCSTVECVRQIGIKKFKAIFFGDSEKERPS